MAVPRGLNIPSTLFHPQKHNENTNHYSNVRMTVSYFCCCCFEPWNYKHRTVSKDAGFHWFCLKFDVQFWLIAYLFSVYLFPLPSLSLLSVLSLPIIIPLSDLSIYFLHILNFWCLLFIRNQKNFFFSSQ